MTGLQVLVFILCVGAAELKFQNYHLNLVNFNTARIKAYREKVHDFYAESFYFSPYQAQATVASQNFSSHAKFQDGAKFGIREVKKRGADTTFRGRPKSIQEVWSLNFNMASHEFSQSTSLVELMVKIISKYMSSCIPVVLYDHYVESSEGYILQRLFQEFPTTFMHGKIGENFTLNNRELLDPPDSKCRSYILFVADALKTRLVIGPQIDNKVVVVPRSTQWKLQEFLSSPFSRDIINLLVIGESYSTDKTKERPYVLYTHHLFVDGLGSNKPKVLTSWMKGRLSRPHIDLFPTKLTKGFAGHRFSVSAADFPPFVFKILKTDGVGNVQIRWDGYEFRILQVLGQRLNFTFDIGEPKNLAQLGPGDAISEAVIRRQYDIGAAGMYITSERNLGMEMSVSHSTDCAAFITLTSKALPRYRAILGPFRWEVWLCLTLVYLVAIIPLAYSDSLSIRYLIEKPGQIENMFWYVFGTFTNSLTFSGEMTWSNSKKTSTRILIGFYWVFTIIITACYTGSIIAFVTLPIFPETVDTIEQLRDSFYRVGTLDKGGWERWFLNSTDADASKLLKNLEFVKDLKEGLGNVTKPYFLFPYSFIGSKAQLEYVVQTNYTDEKLIGRRSALHISDECFALFGVSFAFQTQSVYRQKFNDALLMLLQSGIVQKIKNDVRWDMIRSSTGQLLQVSSGKSLKIQSQDDRGLTLADTEGMFLLLGIGFLIAGGVLISEWVGGCTNKCMTFMKVKRARQEEEHRQEEEIRRDEEDVARVDAEDKARTALESASSEMGITFEANVDEAISEATDEIESASRRGSRHSRGSSVAIVDLNPAMLVEMYKGREEPPNMVYINGMMMNEREAAKYACSSKEIDEQNARKVSEISDSFRFLNDEEEAESSQDDGADKKEGAESHYGDEQKHSRVCQVEINFESSADILKDVDACFGEKIEN